MVALEAFRAGDVYLDYPYEGMKFRYENKTDKVFVRNYGKPECEVERSYSFYREAMSAGTLITRDEYFLDFIGTALALLKPLTWQQAEQRAQNLKTSARAQQALDAVAAGTSAVSSAARDRLRDGLDGLCIDTGWTGLMVAWLECLLSAERGAGAHSDFTADELVAHYLQDCLPLGNVTSGCPVLDASEPDVPSGLPLAMIRQDATLVLAIADAAHAAWLRACAAKLGMENLVVAEQTVEAQCDCTLFQEIISRSAVPPRQILARTQHRMALGGRWYLLRASIDETELQGLPQGAEFVQAIAVPAPGLEAPRQILHIATGVNQSTALPIDSGSGARDVKTQNKPRLPRASDFPAGSEFVICDFDVPLVFVPHQGWFNWFGGVPRAFDTSGLKPGNNRAARSFDEWVAIVEGSLKT